MAEGGTTAPALARWNDERLRQAMDRFAVLRPHLENGVPLSHAADHAGVALRTAERWLSRYRRNGLEGLARSTRCDAGRHRLPCELVAIVEGMGLKRPRSSAATLHRRTVEVAKAKGWPAPSYGTVHAILAELDPAMVTLAHEGAAAFRNRFELIYRHRAEAPNAIWQADHTTLDILGYFQQRYKTRHRLWTWLAALIMKTNVGTPVSTMLFSGIVVTAMTLSGGEIRAHDHHFFVVNSPEDR